MSEINVAAVGRPTVQQCRDTGMALVLLLLLSRYWTGVDRLVAAAIVVQVVNMTAPQVFRPAAVVWFKLSHILGTVMSRIILTTVYFALVTPVGVFRRTSGIDPLQLRVFKAGRESVMRVRNHRYTSADLKRPY